MSLFKLNKNYKLQTKQESRWNRETASQITIAKVAVCIVLAGGKEHKVQVLVLEFWSFSRTHYSANKAGE